MLLFPTFTDLKIFIATTFLQLGKFHCFSSIRFEKLGLGFSSYPHNCCLSRPIEANFVFTSYCSNTS